MSDSSLLRTLCQVRGGDCGTKIVRAALHSWIKSSCFANSAQSKTTLWAFPCVVRGICIGQAHIKIHNRLPVITCWLPAWSISPRRTRCLDTLFLLGSESQNAPHATHHRRSHFHLPSHPPYRRSRYLSPANRQAALDLQIWRQKLSMLRDRCCRAQKECRGTRYSRCTGRA